MRIVGHNQRKLKFPMNISNKYFNIKKSEQNKTRTSTTSSECFIYNDFALTVKTQEAVPRKIKLSTAILILSFVLIFPFEMNNEIPNIEVDPKL